MESNVWIESFRLNFPQLIEFMPRVRINRIPRSPRRLRRKVVLFFEKMVERMTLEEVRERFEECLRCWTNILKHFFKGLEVGELIEELVDALMVFFDKLPCDTSMKWDLLSASATALDRHSDVMLRVLDDGTSEGWSISISTLLMNPDGREMPMAEILIKKGFSYSFDRGYHVSRRKIYFYGEVLEFDRSMKEQRCLRLQHALDLLMATSLRINPGEKDQKGRKQTLLWRAISSPYVSREEFFQLLEPHYRGPIKLEDLCDAYVKENLAFEVPEKPQPRSLQHLARVQVRRQLLLSQGRSIDEKLIDNLRLPKILRNYLKLEF